MPSDRGLASVGTFDAPDQGGIVPQGPGGLASPSSTSTPFPGELGGKVPAYFSASLAFDPPRLVVEVSGDIDLASMPAFEGVLASASAYGDVTVDLGRVSFLAAGGAGIIADAADRVAAAGGQLVVHQPSLTASRVLSLLDLGHLVDPGDAAVPIMPGLRQLARSTAIRDVRDLAVEQLLAAAAELDGVDGSSVTVDHRGRPTTIASSNTTARRMDAMQYEAGEGPCLSAMTDEAMVRARSLTRDDRWPGFLERVLADGDLAVESVVSTPLPGPVRGALNVYSATPPGPSERIVEVLQCVAAGISKVLYDAEVHADDVLEEQLRRGLEDRQVIGQAQGVLMAGGASAVDAAAALHRSAREAGSSVADHARAVVRTTGAPDG